MILTKPTWAKHTDNLKFKVKKSLNLLKVISGFSRVQTKNLLLWTYNAVSRLKLNYTCQIYSLASKSKLDAFLMHLIQ